MLIPEPRFPDNSVRICAVDPGTSYLGLAVLDWVYGEPQAEVVWAGTLHAVDPTHQNSHSEVCGKRDARMAKLQQGYAEFLRISRPTFCCTETPFMQRLKLSAYESGVELQQMLRTTLFEIFPEKWLHGFNPIIVKSYVGVEAKGTDKTHMFNAVTKLYANRTLIDLTALDEHSIDAVAVGNIFVRTSLLSLNSLLPPREKKPKAPKGSRRRSRRRRK
ncbi:putative crossover junction endodeoxyribonuclease RuvC [Erwinia phage vB_EamM_Kwan]|uniref:Putative crossover junction endodeoxyribonuclease RuvC n=1 Tax=Erwinia phage vB_EamM_Kwan TaxID=1883374 RepID=A0A1B2IDU7_9CAUD|nr:putative crossover junction endodeoxyribonuclease RuvC [Erwinia phage vB_EamM_Kwan]ANZ49456.1 putative crossover junction endodeoxyribonuclease RuvC [Erwinia phage vB_EamM_Kwan]